MGVLYAVHARFVQVLRAHRPQLGRVPAHCFTEGPEALADYLDLDCHIGITNWLCDERRGQALRESVRQAPLDRLLIETDAPYLQPRPASRRNVPANLPHILHALARHRGRDTQTVARAVTDNALQFFALPAHWPPGLAA